MQQDDLKILALSGSARRDSWNSKLLRLAAAAIRAAGMAVTEVRAQDYPLPLYCGDLEASEGVPENAQALHRLASAHSGFLFASPEYNGSMTPLLKNTIDWMSRPMPDPGSTSAFRGKPAAIVSASPGRLGGLRSTMHLRDTLVSIGVRALPEQVTLPGAGSAFDAKYQLIDQGTAERLAALGQALARAVRLESH